MDLVFDTIQQWPKSSVFFNTQKIISVMRLSHQPAAQGRTHFFDDGSRQCRPLEFVGVVFDNGRGS